MIMAMKTTCVVWEIIDSVSMENLADISVPQVPPNEQKDQ